MLISTMIIAFARDFSTVLDGIIWTLAGLTIVLAWASIRLVQLVSARTRLLSDEI